MSTDTPDRPWLDSALRDLGIRLDRRGLMSLAQARRRLAEVKVFKAGRSHRIPGQTARPRDGDFLWAALLSLRDAAEFIEHASRLKWRGSARGRHDNTAVVERYGPRVLPWLATQVRRDGTVSTTPGVAIPCLMRLGSPEALEILLRVRRPHHPDRGGLGLIDRWLEAHGTDGLGALVGLAEADHPAAREAIAGLARRAPQAFMRRVARAVGRARARRVLSGQTGDLAEVILETLDAAAAMEEADVLPWPWLAAPVGHLEVHAVRLVAARSKAGDDWGVLFEVVMGDQVGAGARWPACVQRFTYGSRVEPGGRFQEDARRLKLRLKVTDALSKKLDLRPGRSASGQIESWPAVLAIRAALAKEPDAFWTAPKTAVRALKLRRPEIIVETDAFEHVVGPIGSNAKLRRLPSKSPVYKSLARALTRRDPTLFRPGRSNVDWRRYARKRTH